MFTRSCLGIVIVVLTASVAWAGSQIESRVSSCDTTNCSGETIRGTHQAAEPFVTQIFARAGECLRLDLAGFEACNQIAAAHAVPYLLG